MAHFQPSNTAWVDHRVTLETPLHISIFNMKSHHHFFVLFTAPPTPAPASRVDLAQVTNLLTVVVTMMNPYTSSSTLSTPSWLVSSQMSGAESVHSVENLIVSPFDFT